jgi:pimeloyl-ACP methyl ester carboxylesterase
MLPREGPIPHPYHRIDDAHVDVTFADSGGRVRHVRVRHKVLGEGPPLLLVHGLMTTSYSWRYVLEPLSLRYRVLAPDLVGAGRTDKPEDLAYSVENVARFVVAYARAVTNEPVYLVGNSLGGLYALEAVLREGASLARRFVLMHAPGYSFFRTRALAALLGAPGLGTAAAALVARAAHTFPRTFVSKNVHYHRNDIMSEEECTEYGRLFETLAGARVFARILKESLDPREHARIVARLRERAAAGSAFPCPVRLLYARKDVMVPPAFGPLFHADIPGSELVWFDDASHFLQVDAPERTVEAITGFDPDAQRGAA